VYSQWCFLLSVFWLFFAVSVEVRYLVFSYFSRVLLCFRA